jgi:hypothetical protein
MPFLFASFSFSSFCPGLPPPDPPRLADTKSGRRSQRDEGALHLHMMRHLVLHPHIRINDPEVLTEIR